MVLVLCAILSYPCLMKIVRVSLKPDAPIGVDHSKPYVSEGDMASVPTILTVKKKAMFLEVPN